MGYAINSTNTGWRAIDSKADLLPGETYSATQPVLAAQTLAEQIAALVATYETAISQPVTFTTAAGVKQTYQTDPASRQKMADMLNAYEHTGAVPAGFYWVAADNTQVPFTLADLQGLVTEVGAQGWAAFQALQAGKKALGAA